jgi:hypothetical protein
MAVPEKACLQPVSFEGSVVITHKQKQIFASRPTTGRLLDTLGVELISKIVF